MMLGSGPSGFWEGASESRWPDRVVSHGKLVTGLGPPVWVLQTHLQVPDAPVPVAVIRNGVRAPTGGGVTGQTPRQPHRSSADAGRWGAAVWVAGWGGEAGPCTGDRAAGAPAGSIMAGEVTR